MEERIRKLEAELLQLRGEKYLVEQTHASQVKTWAGIVRDAKQQSAQSSRDLRSVLDNMPSMIGYWDRNLRNRFGNHAYAKWFGIDPKTMEGKHIRDVIGEERYRLNLPYMEAALRGEKQQFERAIPSPDGKQIRHSLAEYIPDVVDGEVHGFYALVSDVTSIKNVEYFMQEAQRLGGVGSMCFRINTGLWTSSKVLDELLGIDAAYRRDLSGWMQRIHAEDRDGILAQWHASLEERSRLDWECRIVRANDGALRWAHLVGEFECDDQGSPVQVVLSVQDITERKNRESELIRAKEKAQAANVAKTEFLATISHELRTPLNGVLGMAELLQTPGLSEEQRIEYAAVVIDSGYVLLSLLNDILEISAIDSNTVELDADLLDPNQIVQDVTTIFAKKAQAKQLSVDCDLCNLNASYVGDSRRVSKMLSNLLDNAIKFTEAGGIRASVREIEFTDQSGLLEFAVSDTGIGVAPEKLHLLFHTFSQIDGSSTRRYEGAGLGLSVVRKFAEVMGGEVGVESEVGKGSRFWFRVRIGRSRGV